VIEVTGFGRTTGGSEMDTVALELADRSETDCIRRYRQLLGLRDAIEDAARRAEAYLRLENAMRNAPTR
jgi:hypothetical protein